MIAKLFAKLLCVLFGHKDPDETVTHYYENGEEVWQCPRCGGTVRKSTSN